MIAVYLILPLAFLIAGSVIFLQAIEQILLFLKVSKKLGKYFKLGLGCLVAIVFILVAQYLELGALYTVIAVFGFSFISILLLFIFKTLNE